MARDTSYGDANFLTGPQLEALGLLGGEGIPLGDYAPPGERPRRIHYAGDAHLVTFAPSRTGKGVSQIIPTLLEHDASALVIDPKGQNAAVCARARRTRLGHKVYEVNPFGLHCGPPWNLNKHCFNPLAGLRCDNPNFVANVSALCEALIVSEGSDPHWSNAARDLVSAVIMDMIVRSPETATLPLLRELLTVGIRERIDEMQDSDKPYVTQRAARFAVDSKEVEGVIADAITQTSFLDDPALAACLKGDDFRLGDLKRQSMTVFLILPANVMIGYHRFLRLFVVSALNALMATAHRPRKPVYVCMDEFCTALGHLSAVESAMGLAAGFGVQLHPIIQDTNQMKIAYKNSWPTFLANSAITQIFRVNDLDTAKYFSERAGTYTHQLSNLSYRTGEIDYARAATAGPMEGLSRSLSVVPRPLRTPHELFGMPNNRQMLFVSGSEFPAWTARQPYFVGDRYAGLYDPDPYHV